MVTASLVYLIMLKATFMIYGLDLDLIAVSLRWLLIAEFSE